jgi:hypothetical protein
MENEMEPRKFSELSSDEKLQALVGITKPSMNSELRMYVLHAFGFLLDVQELPEELDSFLVPLNGQLTNVDLQSVRQAVADQLMKELE